MVPTKLSPGLQDMGKAVDRLLREARMTA
jgi:hypothetical protein